MLTNQNALVQSVQNTNVQHQNSNSSMHVKTLAPLPPSHYSAVKTKGGGMIQQPKPYLTLSVEKT